MPPAPICAKAPESENRRENKKLFDKNRRKTPLQGSLGRLTAARAARPFSPSPAAPPPAASPHATPPTHDAPTEPPSVVLWPRGPHAAAGTPAIPPAPPCGGSPNAWLRPLRSFQPIFLSRNDNNSRRVLPHRATIRPHRTLTLYPLSSSAYRSRIQPIHASKTAARRQRARVTWVFRSTPGTRRTPPQFSCQLTRFSRWSGPDDTGGSDH